MESPNSPNRYADIDRNCYVGIDISKDFFDVALPAATGRYRHLKLSNDTAGFKELLLQAKDRSLVFVMEASGPYYLPLASYLHEQGLGVSVVNPLVVRHYSKMLFMRTKTDKKDAALLAAYALSQRPALWEPEAGHVLALKQLQTVARGLQKRQLESLLESLQATGKLNRKAKECLERVISQMEKEFEKAGEGNGRAGKRALPAAI